MMDLQWLILALFSLQLVITSPTSPGIRGPATIIKKDDLQADSPASLLSDTTYIEAWQNATGRIPSNSAISHLSDETTTAQTGPYNGRNNYVAVTETLGGLQTSDRVLRIISLVVVSEIGGGLRDAFTSTNDIAMGFAGYAASLITDATTLRNQGFWASYSDILDDRFTIVARVQVLATLDQAFWAAQAVARAFGLSTTDIPNIWPRKRSEHDENGSFWLFSDFEPGDVLIDYLQRAFDRRDELVFNTASEEAAEDGSISARATCPKYVDKRRIVTNHIPWDVKKSASC